MIALPLVDRFGSVHVGSCTDEATLSAVGDTLPDTSTVVACTNLLLLNATVSEPTTEVSEPNAVVSKPNAKVPRSDIVSLATNQIIGQHNIASTDLLTSIVEAESTSSLVHAGGVQSDAVNFAVNDDVGEYTSVFTNSIHDEHDEPTFDRTSTCPSPDYTTAYSVDDDQILAAFGDIIDHGPYIIPEDSSESSDDDHAVHDQNINIDNPNLAISNRFRNVDEAELQNVMKGGRRRSSQSENWARKAFDEFRKFKEYSIESSIEDLSEAADVVPLVDMLQLFMLQVAKRNGELYPPGT